MIGDVMEAKLRRDLIRDRLVRALAGYELPPALAELLAADTQATTEFEAVWCQYEEEKRERSKRLFR